MANAFNLVKNNPNELPNNIEAEQSVIGSILLSNEVFDEINMILNSKYFSCILLLVLTRNKYASSAGNF